MERSGVWHPVAHRSSGDLGPRSQLPGFPFVEKRYRWKPMTFKQRVHTEEIGQEMYKLIADLYPICRSITGNGLRATLNLLKQYIPLEIHEVPTGTEVFDWT